MTTAKVSETARLLDGSALALIIAGQTYGKPDITFDDVEAMGVPKSMDALTNVLRAESRLLALSKGSKIDAIYDAYGNDLELLARYREGFKKAIEAAVRARAVEDEKHVKDFLDRMAAGVKTIVHEPSLDLGPDAAQLEAGELLERLQSQFRDDADALKQQVAMWMHILAENHLVSVIEWLNPKALRYHFFLAGGSRKLLSLPYVVAATSCGSPRRSRAGGHRTPGGVRKNRAVCVHPHRRAFPLCVCMVLKESKCADRASLCEAGAGGGTILVFLHPNGQRE